MTDDVQPAYRFLVTLDPTDAFVPRELITTALEMAPGAFQTATGLGAELEVTSYPEGGPNDYVHQLPLRHSWSSNVHSTSMRTGQQISAQKHCGSQRD